MVLNKFAEIKRVCLCYNSNHYALSLHQLVNFGSSERKKEKVSRREEYILRLCMVQVTILFALLCSEYQGDKFQPS